MEAFSALLTICAGNSTVHGEFPAQRPVARSFDVFFYLRLNKCWVNSGGAGDLRRYRAHYDGIVMVIRFYIILLFIHILISLISASKRAPGKKRSKIVTIFQLGRYLEFTLLFVVFLRKISAMKCFIWNEEQEINRQMIMCYNM